MKKILLTAIVLITLLLTPASVFAQGVTSDDHTAREETEGKEIWEKLQAKEVTCETLADNDFGALGEYFMGQMMGDAHEAMNNRLTQMMGKDGEEQMHIAMGKRMSGCDPDAPMPQNMMMESGGWNGFGILGWLPMILFWILLILGVVALFRYLGRSGQHDSGKTPLEILKERYTKGEIDKKEFEQMKKDLA